jgi:hypothetical protein
MTENQEILAAFELERLLYKAAAERFERVPCGFVSANPSIPNVWDASRVQVEPDCAIPSLDELRELAELPAVWHPELRARKAFLPGGDPYREIAFSLAREGWEVTELMLMVARVPPANVPAGSRSLEGPVRNRLKGRLGVEQGLPPGSAAEFDRFDELRGRAAARITHAGYEGSTPVAVADAYLRGDICVIEDVATLRRARRQGAATAAVLGATTEALRLSARAVYLFSAADVAEGFYVPLGFEQIGSAWDCTKPPS